MSVTSLGRYEFESRDAISHYKGKQLIYVNWEKHRMFSRPFVLAVAPETPLQAIIDNQIGACYGYHPDFAKIDWSRVTWQKGRDAFAPDPAKTLAENGIGHKDLIRFTTPGLDGIAGTAY